VLGVVPSSLKLLAAVDVWEHPPSKPRQRPAGTRRPGGDWSHEGRHQHRRGARSLRGTLSGLRRRRTKDAARRLNRCSKRSWVTTCVRPHWSWPQSCCSCFCWPVRSRQSNPRSRRGPPPRDRGGDGTRWHAGRIVRQLLTESAILRIVGGCAGMAVAWSLLQAAPMLLPAQRDHSLSTTRGSTADARRAGRYAPPSAAATRTAGTDVKVSGS